MSSEPEAPYVRRSDAEGVATLLLDRPAKLNALSTPMLEALDAEITRLRDDASVRVVVLGLGAAFAALASSCSIMNAICPAILSIRFRSSSRNDACRGRPRPSR